MTDDRDQELRELIALAVVGALDSVERAALDEQLSGRADLRAEMHELEAVAAMLADDVAVDPPAHLRADVLSLIEEIPQHPSEPPADEVAPTPASADVVPLASRRRPRWAPMAAAAAAVIVLAGGGIVLWQTTGDDGAVDVAAVVDDDDAVTVRLDGEVLTLSLTHSAANDAGVLIGDDVPIPEGDQVYELWRIAADGIPDRVDIFRPSDDGRVEMLVTDMEPLSSDVFAITVEPAGGSEQPTSDIIAASA